MPPPSFNQSVNDFPGTPFIASSPSASTSSSMSETITNVVFGTCAVVIGIVTVWQGRNAWKVWRNHLAHQTEVSGEHAVQAPDASPDHSAASYVNSNKTQDVEVAEKSAAGKSVFPSFGGVALSALGGASVSIYDEIILGICHDGIPLSPIVTPPTSSPAFETSILRIGKLQSPAQDKSLSGQIRDVNAAQTSAGV